MTNRELLEKLTKLSPLAPVIMEITSEKNKKNIAEAEKVTYDSALNEIRIKN